MDVTLIVLEFLKFGGQDVGDLCGMSCIICYLCQLNQKMLIGCGMGMGEDVINHNFRAV